MKNGSQRGRQIRYGPRLVVENSAASPWRTLTLGMVLLLSALGCFAEAMISASVARAEEARLVDLGRDIVRLTFASDVASGVCTGLAGNEGVIGAVAIRDAGAIALVPSDGRLVKAFYYSGSLERVFLAEPLDRKRQYMGGDLAEAMGIVAPYPAEIRQVPATDGGAQGGGVLAGFDLGHAELTPIIFAHSAEELSAGVLMPAAPDQGFRQCYVRFAAPATKDSPALASQLVPLGHAVLTSAWLTSTDRAAANPGQKFLDRPFANGPFIVAVLAGAVCWWITKQRAPEFALYRSSGATRRAVASWIYLELGSLLLLACACWPLVTIIATRRGMNVDPVAIEAGLKAMGLFGVSLLPFIGASVLSLTVRSPWDLLRVNG